MTRDQVEIVLVAAAWSGAVGLVGFPLARAAPPVAALAAGLGGRGGGARRGRRRGRHRVRADAAGLSRVVANLVMNAVRHTPEDGVVEIRGRGVPDGVELSVTDGCGGIPAADLDRVFDVAWRGSHARTPGDGGGAGLGLAIVKGIVEAHAGSVRVRNEAPGCRFLVRLPA